MIKVVVMNRRYLACDEELWYHKKEQDPTEEAHGITRITMGEDGCQKYDHTDYDRAYEDGLG